MFSQHFQLGDNGVEVFSASGKSPGKCWKIVGGVHRVYDRTVKGFVFLIDKGIGTSLQCPENNKDTLGLTQPIFILQIRCSVSKPFGVELTVCDRKGERHRMHFSSKFRSLDRNELHTQLPLTLSSKDKWNNLIFDFNYLIPLLFSAEEYQSIESICIYPSCRIRKIITLPHIDISNPVLPEIYQFASPTEYETQVLNCHILYAYYISHPIYRF